MTEAENLTPAGRPEDISPDRYAAILGLNERHVAELSALDQSGLASLLDGAYYARCIGRLDAFLIALDQSHPTYASPNYLWFKARREQFIYVDRIVVSKHARGLGLARLLYADLIARSVADRHYSIVCEVNAEPPNPASDAFHAQLGFEEVGRGSLHGGAKVVRYFELTL